MVSDVIRRSSLRARLLVFSGLGVLSLVVTGYVAYATLSTFTINGPYYQQIVQGKDLVADVLPPPAYIIEPYLVAHQMLIADKAGIEPLVARITALKAGAGAYDERQAHWREALPAGPIKTALTEQAHGAALEFFATMDEKFIPLIKAGQTAQATAILQHELTPMYERHLAAINDVVQGANQGNSAIEADARNVIQQRTLLMVGLSIGFVLLTIAVSVPIVRSIVQPTHQMVDVLEAVGKGDYTRQLEVRSRDELARMAGAMNATIAAIRAAIQATEDAAKREKAQAEELAGKVDQILVVVNAAAQGDLSREVPVTGSDAIGQVGSALQKLFLDMSGSVSAIAQNAHSLAAASEQLTSVSQQVGANSEETSAQANVVSAASEQVSKNVQTVATGAEQMSASIKEIAKNSTDAAKIAQAAVHVAQSTNDTIAKLGESSAEIGQVVKVITSIAQQTNLLALNATIEAARAGEAGKGFAVVANEVKELAKETAKATEDISQKIEAIQADTTGAVQAIARIGEIINQINDISNTIASAVEEQTATTNEIGRNVSEAAKGSAEIAQNISGVALAARSTTDGALETGTSAQALARMAAELQTLVGRFTVASAASGARSVSADALRRAA